MRFSSHSSRSPTPDTTNNLTEVAGKFIPPTKCRQPLPDRHRKYLESRGFDPDEMMDKYRIAGTRGDSDKPWRVVIPVIHHREAVSWIARTILEGEKAKYIAAPKHKESLHHKDILYNADNALSTVILCEGALDVWRVGDGAVATFGVTPSENQILRLAAYPRRIICYDNSSEAQRQANRVWKRLAKFRGNTEIVCLDAEDPGSAPQSEIKQLREYAGLE